MAARIHTVEIVCVQCGKLATRGVGGRPARFCGHKCRNAFYKKNEPYKEAYLARRSREMAARRQVQSTRKCHCGNAIDPLKSLCASCKKEKRSSTLRRAKAIRRGAYVAERFDPIEILERDGWRCHICGRDTPKVLRGSFADNAPELDHIVPISKGGEHSRLNTACACRRCNIVKSNRPLDDLIITSAKGLRSPRLQPLTLGPALSFSPVGERGVLLGSVND